MIARGHPLYDPSGVAMVSDRTGKIFLVFKRRLPPPVYNQVKEADP